MRVAKLFTMLLMLGLAGSAVAGQLSPGLEAYLLEKADGPVTALLILDDQIDVTAMDLDLHFERATLADRHFRVVTTLQEKARATQGALLAEIEARLGQDVESYKAYWLINAIMVTGTEDAVRDLTAHGSVDIAEMNVQTELIVPEITPSEGKAQTRGIGIAPGIVAVGARRVWDELGIRGAGALIGSLDTGVDGDHPAFADRYRGLHAPASECWLDVLGSGTTFPVDNHGHGTHTTGTMTGVAYDDTIGIAPAAEWIAANAIDQGASGGFTQDILDCLEFFTDPDGDPGTIDDVPDVVQNSWGVNENFSGFVDCDDRWWAAIDACEAAGVVLCWSAGNEGSGSQSLRSPADRATTLYNCFSVGATHHYSPYPIWSGSSRGPAGPDCGPVENRTKPEIAAPGADIYSAYPGGGYQGGWNGTSMSGPHVAGVVALMREANPNLDVITIKQVLMETANDQGQVGDDNTYGHGFLDAFEAVQAVMGGLGYVEGTVEDGDTGLPIEGAVVRVVDGYQMATTGADGAYRLTVPMGSVTLTVEAFGYAGLQQVVTVDEDQTTYQDLSMELLPVATVSGTVFAAGSVPGSATPAAGALVEVSNAPVEGTVADASGHFSFDLPAGNEYVFGASVPGEGGLSQIVLVQGDMDLELYLSQLTQDGFETGNFNAMSWTLGGSADWYVQSSTVYAGAYAAQSGSITHNQDSNLAVVVDCGAGGDVSFAYKVSSESNYDYLRYYVDGAQIAEWDGEQGWSEFSHTVTGGSHSFAWAYEKDYSVSDGSDCGWIDDVTFPGGASPVPVCVPTPSDIYVELEPDAVVTVPLIIMNQGAVDLDVTGSATGWASITGGSATVAPYGYHVMQVTLNAAGQTVGAYTQDLVLASNDPANPSLSVPLVMFVSEGSVANEDQDQPGDLPELVTALKGAFPNPFNPMTRISFSLDRAQNVRLAVYDVEGRRVSEIANGQFASGEHSLVWTGQDSNGRDVPSGTYMVQMVAEDATRTSKMMLVR